MTNLMRIFILNCNIVEKSFAWFDLYCFCIISLDEFTRINTNFKISNSKYQIGKSTFFEFDFQVQIRSNSTLLGPNSTKIMFYVAIFLVKKRAFYQFVYIKNNISIYWLNNLSKTFIFGSFEVNRCKIRPKYDLGLLFCLSSNIKFNRILSCSTSESFWVEFEIRPSFLYNRLLWL